MATDLFISALDDLSLKPWNEGNRMYAFLQGSLYLGLHFAFIKSQQASQNDKICSFVNSGNKKKWSLKGN